MSWQDDAACRDHPTVPRNAWIVEGADLEVRLLRRAAVRACADCPVAEPCYELALEVGATAGVWAGEWFDKDGPTVAQLGRRAAS